MKSNCLGIPKSKQKQVGRGWESKLEEAILTRVSSPFLLLLFQFIFQPCTEEEHTGQLWHRQEKLPRHTLSFWPERPRSMTPTSQSEGDLREKRTGSNKSPDALYKSPQVPGTCVGRTQSKTERTELFYKLQPISWSDPQVPYVRDKPTAGEQRLWKLNWLENHHPQDVQHHLQSEPARLIAC